MACQLITYLTLFIIINLLCGIINRLNSLQYGNTLSTTKSIPSNNTLNDKLSEDVSLLKAEVSQLKDLLLKLQAFTMETNQKLLEKELAENE